MNKLFILLLTTLFVTQLAGQVPGYLGKQLLVEAKFDVFPAFRRPTSTSRVNGSGDGLAINLSYELSVGYVLKRRSMISLGIGGFNSGFLERSSLAAEGGYARLGLIKYSAKYTWFLKKHGGIAPLGRSRSLGINVYNLYSSRALDYSGDRRVVSEVNRLSNSRNFVGLSYDWSNRRIFSDRIIVRYGTTLAFLFPSLDFQEGSYYNYQQGRIYQRLLSREFYQVHFSVGYLIF